MKSRVITACLVLCFMTLGVAPFLYSQQQIVLNFTAKNTATGAVQTLDSIQAKDLTRSFDTTLIGVQQLVIYGTTAVDNPGLRVPNGIVLSNNFGNPFSDKTSFYVTTNEATNITLEVFNVLGKKIIGSATQVEAGFHRFRFDGNALEPGVYFLTANVGSYRSTTKMLKIDGGGNANPQLVYEGLVSSGSGSGSSNGFRKAKNIGDDYSFTGFAHGFYSETILDAPHGDTTYEFQFSSIPDHLLHIEFHDGDQFVYNRWTLDSLNTKIESSKRGYRIDIKKGSVFIGGYSDWFYRIGMDSLTMVKDTLYMRTETGVQADGSRFSKFIQVYGFRTRLLKAFCDGLNSKYPMGYPSLPAETWDTIAEYYDSDGNPFPLGTEWFLGPSDGVLLNLSLSGIPITITATIAGRYDAKEEPFTVGAKPVLTWRSNVTADYSAAAIGLDIIDGVSFSFSDDPDGEIIMQHQSLPIMMPLLGNFWVPGEIQELVWYQQ